MRLNVQIGLRKSAALTPRPLACAQISVAHDFFWRLISPGGLVCPPILGKILSKGCFGFQYGLCNSVRFLMNGRVLEAPYHGSCCALAHRLSQMLKIADSLVCPHMLGRLNPERASLRVRWRRFSGQSCVSPYARSRKSRQLLRSGTSIVANVEVSGQSCVSPYARKSCNCSFFSRKRLKTGLADCKLLCR
jgi:hypothetical protein